MFICITQKIFLNKNSNDHIFHLLSAMHVLGTLIFSKLVLLNVLKAELSGVSWIWGRADSRPYSVSWSHQKELGAQRQAIAQCPHPCLHPETHFRIPLSSLNVGIFTLVLNTSCAFKGF